ncbi:hypothetical protein D3C71_2085120 [compost metagenome]
MHRAKPISGRETNSLRLPVRSEREENRNIPAIAPTYGRMASIPTWPIVEWVSSFRMVGSQRV